MGELCNQLMRSARQIPRRAGIEPRSVERQPNANHLTTRPNWTICPLFVLKDIEKLSSGQKLDNLFTFCLQETNWTGQSVHLLSSRMLKTLPRDKNWTICSLFVLKDVENISSGQKLDDLFTFCLQETNWTICPPFVLKDVENITLGQKLDNLSTFCPQGC